MPALQLPEEEIGSSNRESGVVEGSCRDGLTSLEPHPALKAARGCPKAEPVECGRSKIAGKFMNLYHIFPRVSFYYVLYSSRNSPSR